MSITKDTKENTKGTESTDAALLAEAEHWARLTRKFTPDIEQGCAHVLRLTTALRERGQQLAEVTRERDEALSWTQTYTNMTVYRSCIATALARAEQAEAYRHALEQRMICANMDPLLTGDADADLMRFVFHDRQIALSPEAGIIAELRDRAEQAEAQLALCAENTAAADLGQQVECLKAEREAHACANIARAALALGGEGQANG